MGNRKKLRKSSQARVSSVEKLTDRILEIRNTLAGRYNGYICATCDGGFITLDVDHGTTPAETQCLATEGCGGKAISLGYPEGEPPGEPIIYWYKPSKEEFDQLSFEMQEHVSQGGLVRKATEAAPEWVKAIT